MSEQIDTDHRDFPVCPHCGWEHDGAWEWDFGSNLEGTCVTECHACGEEFVAHRNVTVTYSTKFSANAESSHARREPTTDCNGDD